MLHRIALALRPRRLRNQASGSQLQSWILAFL